MLFHPQVMGCSREVETTGNSGSARDISLNGLVLLQESRSDLTESVFKYCVGKTFWAY